jgi:hypothetical protein
MGVTSIISYLLIVTTLSVLTAGCATQSTTQNGDVTKRYIGWLEITGKSKTEHLYPNEKKTLDEGRIERVRTLGLRVANGVSFGYSDDITLALPLDCRLVIVVKTVEQIRQISEIYPQLLKTENLCIKSMDF